MILRLIRGRARRPEVDALRASLARPPGERAEDETLSLRWHLGTRGGEDEVDVLIAGTWDSAEAAARADARSASPLRLAQQRVQRLSVLHFEVDEWLRRESAGAPIAMRVATGRFSRPGADIEMQALLRERLPTIGEEMCEAYVGRRIDGRATDVTFVSLWQRLPDEQPLEETFWSDIALRYDSFVVEVYATAG